MKALPFLVQTMFYSISLYLLVNITWADLTPFNGIGI